MNQSKIDILIKALIDEQKDINLTDLFNMFINHSKTKCRFGTIDRYTKDFGVINSFLFKNNIMTVNALNVNVLDKFVNYCKSRNNKPITINQYISILKFMINYAIKNDLINENPIRHFEKVKEDTYNGDVLNQEQVTSILRYVDSKPNTIWDLKMKCMVYIMFDTGVRMNELLHIKFSDLKLNENKIQLSYTKAHENRCVYIVDKTKKTLQTYVQRVQNNGYLFSNIDNQLCSISYRRYLRSIGKELNLPFELNNRLIRRTFATLLAEQNINISYLMELMGHHNLRTTQRYIKANKKAIQDTHNLLSIVR